MRKKVASSQLNSRVAEALNRLKVAKEVVYDAETSGLDFKRNHIVGHVLSFGPAPQDSYYLPVRHAPGGNIGGQKGPQTAFSWDRKLHPVEQDLIKHLDRPGLTMIGHNLHFDLKFLSTIDFDFNPRCEDTMINEPLLDEFVGRYSLESCAHRRGVQHKKSDVMIAHLNATFPETRPLGKSAMGHFWRLSGDDPVAVEYAEGDGTTTWQLRDKQTVQLCKVDHFRGKPVPTLEQVWDVESRLIPVLARMSVRGIKIDEQALSNLKKHIKTNLERLYNAFPSGFNAKSPNNVREWMEQHGHTDWPMTAPSRKFPYGQPSFVQGWLQNSDAGKKIVEVRKFETLRDTFVMPLEMQHVWKGRVHPTINQMKSDEYGTIAGRLSESDPNLTAVPKHDDETQVVPMGPLYRALFVSDEGKIWGNADYNQCEPRLLAEYSGCKALIKGYMANPPVDAHTTAAMYANKNWPNLSPADKKYYRNQYAKRINQTIITGGGKGVLVSKYKVPVDEVDTVWRDYHRAMPEIRIIQKKMEARFRERGYMLTLLNRRCRLDDPDRSYVALNRILQGGNADILKIKLVETDEYLRSVGRPVDVLNSIHDDVAYQFSEDERKHYDKCLQIMQSFGPDDVIQLNIPMPVDTGEGANWGIATYGEHK